MKRFFAIIPLICASFASAGEMGSAPAGRSGIGGDPYWSSSDTAPWYDSFGRLHHGYREAPMKDYPPGKEPYYDYGKDTPWYDRYGRLRHGPAATDTREYKAGDEPYFHYSESTPWYDSSGRLRYGPRGIRTP